ncbi:FecR domain-containing protein [Halomonas sabkhae]|uniref:FecR domain-containing protein n=1 Tax=Halomonas sabkhae TaxID=626223 RepID=UPI0025B5DF37|nr:FecR domain-containing protein [Halomonas sabkhae]MDN3525869.1 FecR domain-containing protein [Halomonas sabkhae]
MSDEQDMERDERRRALSEAAEWFAQWRSGEMTEAQRDAWQEWHDSGAQNRWAWARIEALSQRLGGELEDDDRQAVNGVIAEARRRRTGRQRLWNGLASLMAMAVLTGLAWQPLGIDDWTQRWGADYHTATGEIRRVTLDDGSRLWLNTASAVNVDDASPGLRLELVSGEVLIDTGRGRLVVETPNARLTPLGTRFDVRLGDSDETLSVFEGAVKVRPRAADRASEASRVIETGQESTYTSRSVASPRPAEPAGDAWTGGVLLADGMPLGQLVEELGRYHHARLRVAPEVADQTLLGAFPLQDLEQSMRMIDNTLPVRVRRVMPLWIEIEPDRVASVTK